MDATIRHNVKLKLRNHHWRKDLKHAARTAAGIAPLLTAIIAPLSTLYDIPGLSQRWYTLNGVPIPDPPANIALSALTLSLNIIANGLLIFRFSSRQNWWKFAMISSTCCWIAKVVIAVVNLAIFGASTRNDNPGYAYSDGFWAAIFSCFIAGWIAIFLVFAALVQDREHTADSSTIRVQARHFLMTELLFFSLLALEALVISKIEGWSWFSGLYFALVTATTCGFGSDYAPTTTAAKIITFPFAVATIAGLAAQVSSIIDFFSARAQARKDRWRLKYEERQEKANSVQRPTDELIAEMQYLDKTIRQEDKLSRLYDLIFSLAAFITFWVVGAVVFSHVEDWSIGNSLYFCWVFFLTIGYGDFYPKTSCGRVFFCLYAIFAVPIVASFAVQTISGIMSAVQQKRLEQAKIRRGITPNIKKDTTIPIHREEGYADLQNQSEIDEEGDEEEINPFISHADLVTRRHEHYRDFSKKPTAQGIGNGASKPIKADSQSSAPISSSDSELASLKLAGDNKALETQDDILAERASAAASQVSNGRAEARTIEIDIDMFDELLVHSLHLEHISRKLIIKSLDQSSKGRLLLQADVNLMQRATALYHSNDPEPEVLHRPHMPDESDLEQIHIYRESFARLLVAATRLRKLEGQEQLKFERRRGYPYLHGYPVKGDEPPST